MINIIKILPVILLMSCVQPIALKHVESNGNGIKMYGLNNERTFYINETIGDSLQLIWQNETPGSFGNYSPIIFGDYLLINDLAGSITVFEKETGKLIGQNVFSGEIAVTPIAYSFKIFIAINYSKEDYSVLYCYDFNSAKIVSEKIFYGDAINELIITGNELLLLTNDGTLHKFNLVGFEIGKLETNTLTQCNPAANKKNIFWANQKGELISVDISKNEILYQKKISAAVESGISLKDNYGYMGDVKGDVYCFDQLTGDVIWKQSTGAKIKCEIVVTKDKIFAAAVSGKLFCLNPQNGNIIYSVDTKGVLNATPLAFNNIIIVPDLNESVHIIDVETGKIIRTIKFERRVKMSPVYYDNKIFIGADRGQIYAFKAIGN